MSLTYDNIKTIFGLTAQQTEYLLEHFDMADHELSAVLGVSLHRVAELQYMAHVLTHICKVQDVSS